MSSLQPLVWTVEGADDSAIYTLRHKDYAIEVRQGGDSRIYPWLAVEDGTPWFEHRWKTADLAIQAVEDTVRAAVLSR